MEVDKIIILLQGKLIDLLTVEELTPQQVGKMELLEELLIELIANSDGI